MYLEEFNAIQAANPGLPESAWQEIHRTIFFQRKLKSAKHLIGRCSCIPQKRRAPMWHPLFQRYRVLEQVNNIRVHESGAPRDRRLTDNERRTLCEALCLQESMSIAGVKRTLKLKGAALSLEATGSGELIGDRTSTTMRKAFGEHWDSMSESERTEALLDVHSYEKGEALAARATTRWRLSDDSATALVDASLEPGYASLSTHALSQLLPLLETGLNSREAMDRAFPGRFSAQKEADRLAPVQRVLGDIRNPVVMRS
jgi:CRISPR-associated endonuclease Csn1